MKKYLEIMAVSVIVGATVFGFLRLAGSLPISVTSTAKQSTFDVSGEGKVVVKPDEARVTLGVHKENASVKVATEEVDRVMADLSKRLKELGVSEADVKTTNYSVYQNYTTDSSVRTYTANSSVEVTVRDIDKTGEVIDLIGALKLEQSGGLMFTLSDELKDKTMQEAREKSIAAAKKKANELAKIAGMKLGRIVNVQEGYAPNPVPMYTKAEVARDTGMGGGTPVQIETGSSELTVNITLSYETL